MEQRSHEWRMARLGQVTASRFHEPLTESKAAGIFSVEGERGNWAVLKQGEVVKDGFARKADAETWKRGLVDEWRSTHWSATAESYLNEKLAELITCQPSDTWSHPATEWGQENEPYAFEQAIPAIAQYFGSPLDLPEDEYAYIEHATEEFIGCSPDGICGKDGLLEIKCPYNPSRWIGMKRFGLTVPREYVPQVQGSLWVTGRKWYAFCYYDPRMMNSGVDPLQITKVERDDAYIDNVLAPRVIAFRDYLRAEYKRLVGQKEPF